MYSISCQPLVIPHKECYRSPNAYLINSVTIAS